MRSGGRDRRLRLRLLLGDQTIFNGLVRPICLFVVISPFLFSLQRLHFLLLHPLNGSQSWILYFEEAFRDGCPLEFTGGDPVVFVEHVELNVEGLRDVAEATLGYRAEPHLVRHLGRYWVLGLLLVRVIHLRYVRHRTLLQRVRIAAVQLGKLQSG